MDDELIILNYYGLLEAVVKRAHLDAKPWNYHTRRTEAQEFLDDMMDLDTFTVPLRRTNMNRALGSDHGSNWVVT